MGVISRKVALIVGSSRTHGNSAGLASWLSNLLQQQFAKSERPFEVVTIDSTTPPLPLGSILDGTRFPGQITDPSQYSSQAIRDWSAFVSSCAAVVILTPEFNGGYPGDLKNSIDHLSREWRGKPVMLVVYSIRGGASCAAQLRGVMKSLSMRVVEREVQMLLPVEYGKGAERVVPGQPAEFLSSYETLVEEVASDLIELIV
ncbi:unnamed protein product [Somion occarium]|uniref:NADPH-dependent FMN reductase-like domain-containing protein n=1 Tax=Somion occarium TaxID=3059160 RepID=A0ABP1CNJ0_9APHY